MTQQRLTAGCALKCGRGSCNVAAGGILPASSHPWVPSLLPIKNSQLHRLLHPSAPQDAVQGRVRAGPAAVSAHAALGPAGARPASAGRCALCGRGRGRGGAGSGRVLACAIPLAGQASQAWVAAQHELQSRAGHALCASAGMQLRCSGQSCAVLRARGHAREGTGVPRDMHTRPWSLPHRCLSLVVCDAAGGGRRRAGPGSGAPQPPHELWPAQAAVCGPGGPPHRPAGALQKRALVRADLDLAEPAGHCAGHPWAAHLTLPVRAQEALQTWAGCAGSLAAHMAVRLA